MKKKTTKKVPDKHSIEYLQIVVSNMFTALQVPEFMKKKKRSRGLDEIEVTKDGFLTVFGDHGIWAEVCEVPVGSIDGRGYPEGGKKVTVPGFVVGTTAFQRNYPHEPDDWEPVEQGTFQTAWQAAEKIAYLYFEDKLRNIMEMLSYEEMNEEEKQALEDAL